MKRLYLLRHAQALPAYGLTDFERTLSDDGKAEAFALGKAMISQGYQPDIIYCSPAIRTRQTLNGVLENIKETGTEFVQRIYESSAGKILGLIQDTPPNLDAILIVAHNPSIHQIAASFADERSEGYENLMTGYAPGTLTALDCDLEDWKNIQPGENVIADILMPKDYAA